MHLVFHHSVAKQLHEPELNEDYYRPTHHVPNGPFVVSDGASESYDARIWSRLLVSRYRKRPRFDASWIAQATARYAAYRNPSTLSWSKQAAFERGSFATLLALHLARDFSRADFLAVGDTLAVFGIDGVICNSFPYNRQINSLNDQYLSQPYRTAILGCSKTWTGSGLRGPCPAPEIQL
jgi:hypothetical protein